MSFKIESFAPGVCVFLCDGEAEFLMSESEADGMAFGFFLAFMAGGFEA